MVIFQILLLSDKRIISKERNTVRASNPRASLTWTDNTSKVGYAGRLFQGRMLVGLEGMLVSVDTAKVVEIC